MINITQEVLDKYNFPTFTEYFEEWNDGVNTTEMIAGAYCRDFLSKTENIPTDIIEELIESLADINSTELLTAFYQFIKKIRIEYKDILAARKLVKKEYNKLIDSILKNQTE